MHASCGIIFPSVFSRMFGVFKIPRCKGHLPLKCVFSDLQFSLVPINSHAPDSYQNICLFNTLYSITNPRTTAV